jgi:transcriptional regulator with XRE-family HTH domain
MRSPQKSRPSTSARTCDPIDALVGRNIRIHRLDKGLTQSEVASRIGVTFQQLQKYEQGVNRIGGGRLFKLAEVLELPISALFEGGPGNRDDRRDSALALLAQSHAVRLLRPFSQIRDMPTRRALVAIVERLAARRYSR